MLKKISRFLIFPFIQKIGITKFLIKKANKNIIICYHGVSSSPNFNINNRHIHLDQFKKDIIFYKKNFDIVNLKDFFEGNVNETNKKPKLVLTFDDGYLNNFTNVLPIAEEFNIPVVFFIISASLDNSNFITWYDLLDFVKQSNDNELEINKLVFKKTKNGEYIKDSQTIENYIKSLGLEREAILIKFYEKYKTIVETNKDLNPEYWKLVDKGKLEQLINFKNLFIGSHTKLHFNLGNIKDDLINSELKNSKLELENICGYEINSIAYPDGSYNENVKDLASKNGYKYQLAVDYKFANDKIENRIMNRFSISNSTTHESNMLRLALQIKKYGV